jgi:hypothetical protein
MKRACRTVWAALAIGVAITALPVNASPAQAAPERAQGVFRGSGKVTELREYERWLGQPVTHALDFWGGNTTAWEKIENPAWICNQYKNSGITPEISLAILPNKTLNLADGAAGKYNAHWTKFAQVMVQQGCGDYILRLGWEFNGKFYPWAAGGKEAQYAEYWRQIVRTVRAVAGTNFKFDWSPLAGNNNADVEAAYPGDRYVDYIGLDTYDTSTIQDDNLARWNQRMNEKVGLLWHKNFAAKHGKPMTFPEWGVTVRPNDNLGGGDNPFYIEKMYQWIHSNNVAFHMYFEVDAKDAAHRLMTSQFPKSSARYRALFGGTPPTSTTAAPPATSTTTAPPATSTTTAPPATTVAQSSLIKVSRSSSRRPSWSLAGTRNSREIFVFVPNATNIARVEWRIDDPTLARAPRRTDTSAPWDLVGGTLSTATAFDTATLTAGDHTATAKIWLKDGSSEVHHGTWTVASTSSK